MKKILSLLVSLSIIFTACSKSPSSTSTDQVQDVSVETVRTLDFASSYTTTSNAESFHSAQDDELLTYMEDVIYYDLVSGMAESEYCVENVQAVYVSQEYIEELTYNSQENIYFGYHLSDIQEAFGDTPWFFTVDENGQTVVTEYKYEEFEFNFTRMLRDVVIGSGVILVCATVSLLTAPALPAVSMIMMVSAKTATVFALSSGALGAVSSGLITYVKTGDVNQSLQAAMDGGGKGYKIGAITGAVMGAAKEVAFLRHATASKYLTMNEAAIIQRESHYPADVIAQIHNMQEYEALKSANLEAVLIGNKTALIPKDIEFTEENIRRMMEGKAPLDINGNAFELHHMGQEANGTLAMLTREQHDNIALHGFKEISEIDRNAFGKQRAAFYKYLAELVQKGV